MGPPIRSPITTSESYELMEGVESNNEITIVRKDTQVDWSEDYDNNSDRKEGPMRNELHQNVATNELTSWLRSVANSSKHDSKQKIRNYMESLLKEYPDASETHEQVIGHDNIQQGIRRILECAVINKNRISSTLMFTGILLLGVPGSGKTLILRESAKKVAAEMKRTISVMFVNVSDLMSKYVGDSEKSVRCLFEVAVEHEPTLIMIDEVDSLMGKRNEESAEHSIRFKSELLTQMDGCNQTRGVAVVATTNRPESLDTAFLRRFQLRYFVGLPSAVQRVALFRKFLHYCEESHEILWEDIDFNRLAKQSVGLTGDDIKTVIKKVANSNMKISFLETLDTSSESGNDDVLANTTAVAMDEILKELKTTKPTYDHKTANELIKWAKKNCTTTIFDEEIKKPKRRIVKHFITGCGVVFVYCCLCGCCLKC